MSNSIVFKIDHQMNVLEGGNELSTLLIDFGDKQTLKLNHFFTPNAPDKLQTALENLSKTSVVLTGTLPQLANNPAAKLFLHCYDNTAVRKFECVLVFDNRIALKPPEILSSLFKHNPLPFYCFDKNGKFIHVNDKLMDFTGETEEELLKKDFVGFIHPADLELTFKQFNLTLEGVTNQYEITVLVKNGMQKRIRVYNFPRIEQGEVTGVYGIFEDITNEKESEARWRELVEQSPLPVSVYVDGRYVFTNSAAPAFYGLDSVDELIGRSVYEFVPDDEIEELKNRQYRLENNEHIEPGEGSIITKSGEKRTIVAHSRPIVYQGKQAIQSVIIDITELKEQKAIIEKSLKEKETLLKEIHHRVKNNLAIISGLIELQIKKVDNQKTIDVLKDSQNRILSIALVHQLLYQVETLDEINVGNYVEELITNLSNSFQQSGNLNINVFAEDVFLDIEQAVPCSLIINEVVVNSIKHGFNKTEQGTIDVYIEKNPNFIQLKIEDNGKGIPEDVDFENANTLGITLIKILTQQLEGTYLFDKKPDGGTRFILRFPWT